MNAHIERIMRDLKEMLEELYDDAYQEGVLDQERDDIVRIDDAYDRGADEGSKEGKKEVKN
jgi:hypothetical protein